MHPRSGRVVVALLVAGIVAGCGGGGGAGSPSATPAPRATPTDPGTITRHAANRAVTLRIGSKNFTEQVVLGQIYAQGLAAAGYRIRTSLDLGDQDTLLRAIEKGRIDAYPEYTGTALLAFFGKRSDEIPRSDQAAYEEARAGFAAEHPPLVAYPPPP
jgi:glycine betaine/choline ABC-type transport system substrate-binding protein